MRSIIKRLSDPLMILRMVRVTGFEPAASCSQSRRATNCATPGYLVFSELPRVFPKQARYQLRYTRMTELYYSKAKEKSPLKIVEKKQRAAEMVGERGLTTEARKVYGEKL